MDRIETQLAPCVKAARTPRPPAKFGGAPGQVCKARGVPHPGQFRGERGVRDWWKVDTIRHLYFRFYVDEINAFVFNRVRPVGAIGSFRMIPSSNAIWFKMSISVMRLLRFCAALCLGFTLLCVGWLVTSWSTLKAQEIGTGLFSILMFGGAGCYCSHALRRGLVQTAVDETGIWRLQRNRSPILIAWHDVNIVKSDDTWQRLIVSDSINTFKIDYQIYEFNKLFDYIIEKLP
jgi:hypothetical protein